MAHVIFYIAAMAAIFASAFSNKCTKQAVQTCFNENNLNNDDCPNYEKIIDCIHTLYASCEGDVKKSTDSSLKHYKRVMTYYKTMCPGMPSGTCYFNLVRQCDKSVPYGVTSKYRSHESKVESCKGFNGDSAIACVKKVMVPCSSSVGTARMNSMVSAIEKVQKVCDAL